MRAIWNALSASSSSIVDVIVVGCCVDTDVVIDAADIVFVWYFCRVMASITLLVYKHTKYLRISTKLAFEVACCWSRNLRSWIRGSTNLQATLFSCPNLLLSILGARTEWSPLYNSSWIQNWVELVVAVYHNKLILQVGNGHMPNYYGLQNSGHVACMSKLVQHRLQVQKTV